MRNKQLIVPEDFPYRDIILKGRPRHDKYDPFLIQHPPMPASRWAKIYAPFDALRGFKEEISAKTLPYEERRILGEDEAEELNEKLHILKDMLQDSRATGQKPPRISVTYYKPCQDVGSEAYGCMGTYETISGVCLQIDTDLMDELRIEQEHIQIKDITEIQFINL